MREHLASLAMALCALLLFGPGASWAQGTEPAAVPFFGQAIDDARLDSLRGGFALGELRISLALERTTSVNGELLARTRFDIADFAAITPEQARSVAAAIGQASVIQIGPGSRFEAPAGFAGTVVQNSLDNQTIRQTTVLDTTSNSLGLLSRGNAQITLRDALAVPLLGR